MDWKEAGKNLFKKNKNSDKVEDNNQVEDESFEEPVKDDGDFNPKESDTKNKNRKVVFILSILLIFFGLFIYVASKSRERPKTVEKKEEVFDLTGVPEDEIEESSSVYELKKELEELKQQLNQKQTKDNDIQTASVNQSNYNTGRAGGVSNPKVNPVNTEIVQKPVNTGYNTNVKPVNQGQKLVPQQDQIAMFFPDKPIEEKPKKYVVKVLDNPFQGKTFASLYTDIGFPSAKNHKKADIIDKAISQNSPKKETENKDTMKTKKSEKEKKAESNLPLEKTDKGASKFTIPAGSFFKVILLNGVDAPTGMKGKSAPYPVVARVLTNSVLPNRFFADMKGCFVLGEAVGELYNERAIIRFTKISCVTKKGKVIQKNILGALSGEDGKIGLAGRVVSKSGSLLARTLLAKFAESAGNIFSLQAQVISTSGVGTVTTIKPSEAGKAATYAGLAGAAKTLSDYYLELADQTFPVVEINAGRQGDVILLKSLTIDINSDFKDNGAFIQRTGVLVSDSPEEKVFKVEER